MNGTVPRNAHPAQTRRLEGGANVVPFPGRKSSADWFGALTIETILARHAAGELDPELLRALAQHAVGRRRAI